MRASYFRAVQTVNGKASGERNPDARSTGKFPGLVVAMIRVPRA
jgi:hypothetical protein